MMEKVLKYGMVGGGTGSFIGEIHRKAIALDGKAKLVAGCFSRSYENTLETGDRLGVAKDRLYKSFEEMAKAEAARPDGIDFVIVVTPNASHYAICKAFLDAGIAVSCDKPLAVSLAEAKNLETAANAKNLQFMATYTYSGYVTVMQAKALIEKGAIGDIRTIVGEYPQGWLAIEDISGNKQGEWRTDPTQSGNTNALGDIGTHIENTVYRMTNLKIRRLLSKMEVIVPNRKLDDNSFVMVEYDNGASGMYWASQIALGHDNGLRIRIYGTKGSLFWFQEEPEILRMSDINGVLTEIHRGNIGILPAAAKYQRLPGGHPEGLFSAMANLYSNFIDCLNAQKNGTFSKHMIEYPTVSDGVNGLKFIEAALISSKSGNIWVDL